MRMTVNEINQTAEFLSKELGGVKPVAVIVLGSGLGGLATAVEKVKVLPYKDIPNMPQSTVAGHAGNLIIGQLAGKDIIAMQGRVHYYEGNDMKMVTFAMRVFCKLGIRNVLLSNAAGGVNPSFKVGDIMLITDHINMFPDNPLRGANLDEFGPRFPDMTHAYSPTLLQVAREAAEECRLDLKEGVYLGTQGPSFETPAEYRFFATIGADAVGMSTVPEVIVAVHGGMSVMALSTITNCGLSGTVNDHADVQRQANLTEPRMTALVKAVISRLG